jgi:hypothetical protein
MVSYCEPHLNIMSTCGKVAPADRHHLEDHLPQEILQTTTIFPSATGNSLDTQIKQLQLTGVAPESFSYLAPLELYRYEKPYLSRLPCLNGLKRTNIASQNYPVTVFDVSGHEELFTLSESGFQFSKFPVQINSWTDSSVCSTYMPMLSEWLKQQLNCERVFLYAYNVSCRRFATFEAILS